MENDRDPVVEEVEKVKREFQETEEQLSKNIKSIEECVISSQSNNSLPRLKRLADEGLKLLGSLQVKLDFLAPQLPYDDQVQQARDLANSWEKQIESLRSSLRKANLRAKENIIKTAELERELLFGGEGSTVRRRNLQTKEGMTSAAESITESLRRSRQLMVQEVERSASTLVTFDESTGVLGKADSEYKGHRSLLMRTRNLLSTMQRQDVIDRVIVVVGFLLFSLAVLYVVSKRIGLLKLQRKLMDAVKAGIVNEAEVLPRGGRNAVPQVVQEAVPLMDLPLEQHMRDEL